VVADQLKLASDTIRPVGTGGMLGRSNFDPPEAAAGGCSPAADIWALGVTLVEALTGRAPPDLDRSGEAVVLPPEFPSEFRATVARCLSVNPRARPSPNELLAWANGTSGAAVPSAPEPAPVTVAPSKPQVWPQAMLAVAVVLVLGWIGRREFRADRPPTQPPPRIHAAAGARPQTARVTASQTAPARASDAPARQSPVGAAPSAAHEEIPNVPLSARRTIHGHIKVWVRVIVEQDGSVSAADTDLPGPSRYFRRLAIEAAKKWTFPAVDTAPARLMQVRFDFSRDGTTGRAVALHVGASNRAQ
jgi:outer membrane biosynthesis protein TonB